MINFLNFWKTKSKLNLILILFKEILFRSYNLSISISSNEGVNIFLCHFDWDWYCWIFFDDIFYFFIIFIILDFLYFLVLLFFIDEELKSQIEYSYKKRKIKKEEKVLDIVTPSPISKLVYVEIGLEMSNIDLPEPSWYGFNILKQ